MKKTKLVCLLALLSAALFTGCQTTSTSSSSGPATSGQLPVRYKAEDGRTIEIGHRTAEDGGWRFKEPHLEKCWIADGFDFKGYDTLYIAPVTSIATIHDDEKPILEIARQNLVNELKSFLTAKGFFRYIILGDGNIRYATPGGVRALKLNLTITEFHKGGGAARYFAGLYGAGQPVLRVHGVMTDKGKTVFDFEARRSGASAAGRLGGGFMKDEDVQMGDIHSMVLDLTDFMAAIAGKYPPQN